MAVPAKFTHNDRALVEKLVTAGASRVQIAKALGCSTTTLKRHFAELLNGKHPRGVAAREYTQQDRGMVSAMVAFGVVHTEIARLLGIGATSFKDHFAEEIATGTIRANSQVATALFRAATTGGSVRAMTFWLKARAGWVEAQPEDHAPKPTSEANELRTMVGQLDAEGRAAYRKVLEQLGGTSPLSSSGPADGETIQ